MSSLETILNIRVEGTSEMVKLKEEIDKTSKEIKKLKKEQKDSTKNTEDHNRKIVEAETKLKGMRSALTKSKTELIKMNTAAKTTGNSYNDLTKKNAALSIQLRKLQDPLGKNKKEFQKLSKQINTNTNKLKAMDAAMGRSQRNVGNYGGAIKGMALQIGAAIMAFKTLERVIGIFVDFEFQIKQVGVISGATADEMLKLEESAKLLGRTTAFTAGEVAALQKELAKLGFKPEEVNAMTSSVLDLAFAFGDDLGETATQVGVVLRGFNLDASEASRVTDVMAAAFSNTALDLSKFATAMPKVASVAKTMGFDLEDTTAILGVLANTGMEASTAGTAMKNIFLKLANPTGALATALGRNVTSVDELVPAMQELQERGIDVAGMLEITDKRSVTAFASLLSGAGKLEKLNKTLKTSQGTTKKFADTMRDTTKGALDELKSSAEGFAMELIERMQPALDVAIEAFKGLFAILTYLAPVIQAIIVGFATYNSVLLINRARVWAVDAATKAYTVTTALLTGGLKKARIAMAALNISIKANPFGLLLSVLAGAVALLYSFTQNASDAEKELTGLALARSKFNEIEETHTGNQAREIANVQRLIGIIKTESNARKTRTDAVKALNKIAGTNIENLDNEQKLTKDLGVAYKEAVKQIKAKIIMTTAQDKAAEVIKEEIKAEEDLKSMREALNREYQRTLGITLEQAEADEVTLEVGMSMNGMVYETITGQELLSRKKEEVRAKEKKLLEESTEDYVIFNGSVKLVEEAEHRVIRTERELNTVRLESEEIISNATTAVDQLIGKLNKEDEVLIDNTTAWGKKEKAVADAEKALKKAIATDGDTTKASEALKKARKELTRVTKIYGEENKRIDDELKDNNEGLKQKIESSEEAIRVDKLQLKALTDLEDAGARIAKQRIELALKVAKAELDALLMSAQVSTDSTKTQIDNITKLQNSIAKFQNQLKAMKDDSPTPSGFLNSAIFGTSDAAEGEEFTGRDFVDALSATLGQVSNIMSSVSNMQNTILNEELKTMTDAKNKEMEMFKKTAEYEKMTEEEKETALENIAKKHDDAMLKLKIEQFERDQKMQTAQAIISGAQAIMSIWAGQITGNPLADSIIKGIMTAAMVTLTGIQLATIKAQKPPTAELGGIMDENFFADGGMVRGKSHAEGGEKFAVGGRVVELEGGEAVINKRSTAMFKPLLSNINEAGGGRKFADGGIAMATDMLEQQTNAMAFALSSPEEQQVLLVEADVTQSQKTVANIEAQASF